MLQDVKSGGYYRDSLNNKYVIFTPDEFKISGMSRMKFFNIKEADEIMKQIFCIYADAKFFGINYEDEYWSFMSYNHYGECTTNCESIYNLVAPA